MSEADEKVVAAEVGNEQANKDAKLEQKSDDLHLSELGKAEDKREKHRDYLKSKAPIKKIVE